MYRPQWDRAISACDSRRVYHRDECITASNNATHYQEMEMFEECEHYARIESYHDKRYKFWKSLGGFCRSLRTR